MDHHTIVIGSIFTQNGITGWPSGGAYVFQYDTNTTIWVERPAAYPSDGETIDYFATSVAIDGGNVWVGAAVCLDEFVDDSLTDEFPSAKQVIQGISSIQLQAQGTFAGELLRRPMCWYFRDGQGLLAQQGGLVVDGDNRFHAILGNRGPAKFVNASRLAPALIALGAQHDLLGRNRGEPGGTAKTVADLQLHVRVGHEGDR